MKERIEEKMGKYLSERRNDSITLNKKEVDQIIGYIEDVIDSIESGNVSGEDASLLKKVMKELKD